MKRPAISVVIIGKNEEKNVRECLESVFRWSEEIVFVDDNSTDSTLKIVKEYTSSIFYRKMELEGRQRNFGANQAKYDWIMILDCDERATSEVKEEIDNLFEGKKENEIAFWIPRKNYIGDYWLKWGGWYPAPHIKLYDRRYLSWKECAYDIVHPGITFVEGYRGGKNLKNHLIHYNYKNIEDFISKTNRLTTLDAIKWYLDGRNMTLFRGLFRSVDRFFRRYLRKKGHKDGYYGFVASYLSGFYEFAAYSKYREIVKKGYYLKEHNITDEMIASAVRKIKVSTFKKMRIFCRAIPMIIKTTMRNIQNKKFETEVKALNFILKPDDICFDVGGAYGRYAYPMSKLVKKGSVFSFEPGRYSHCVLLAIKKIFRLKNIIPVKKALGDEEKDSFLVSPVKPNGKTGYSLSYINDAIIYNAKCEPIEVTTIDAFFDNSNIDKLDFIKCDTEGAEMIIFRGGEKTIKKNRPVILCEVEEGHLKRFNSSADELKQFFLKLSYEFFCFKNQKFVKVDDMFQDSNYFLIPKEKTGKLVR